MSNRRGYYIQPKPIQTFPDYGPSKCVYCGKALPKHKRKYCCWHHGILYKAATADNQFVSWAEIRLLVLKRDDYTCQRCHTRAKDILNTNYQVHHKIPVCVNPALEFEMSNLETRCPDCHTHKGLWGKRHLARQKALAMVKTLDKFVVV